MRCNFYKYERKLQRKILKGIAKLDVISINMKGNYNEHTGQMGICDDVIPINMKENYNK